MPQMRLHSSGGIVFVPTKEEREIRDLKKTLRSEIEEVQKLRDELLKLTQQVGDKSNAND
jgi:regulator of replication initiation timing